MWQQLLQQIQTGDIKALARSISMIENEYDGYEELLRLLPGTHRTKIIGITGPPGAGKSTLVDGLVGELVKNNKKVAVLCVDPSSPFNMGAVLGDRIRMSQWYTNANVFIRSLASRGSMGGLHPKIIEITELVKAANYHYIVLETVGVGQSEIDIAGLADITVVVVVPESGDEIQTMKAGLMEIADIFVVNKSDRPDADAFVKNLRLMLAPTFTSHKVEVPIIKTVASEGSGIKELSETLEKQESIEIINEKKLWLLTDKVYLLLQQERMKNLKKALIRQEIESRMLKGQNFNLYQIVQLFN
jgi:LAO/AO transport system kinase